MAETMVGRRPDRPNRAVPPKLLISSPGAHGLTKIIGRWNWISRSRNGSSLKRPLRVDPHTSAGETSAQQQERGAFCSGEIQRNATRDGEQPRMISGSIRV